MRIVNNRVTEMTMITIMRLKDHINNGTKRVLDISKDNNNHTIADM